MRLPLQLSILTLAWVWAVALEIPMSAVVKETLIQLSTHRALLTSNETVRLPVPTHKNHQLCIGEIFQGLDILKNQTARGGAVETLFQNLSLIKKYIDRQKEKCGEERRRARQFLDYLQEFLGVMSTEWTMEG
ncbi:interleukin-5 [Meriones unguiculatus]|uniref:Interleukin-5 n=1 Tax=Meriones unguiculatus TaxID=10047 RepID=IL5_MERUN|nr:interleukin-5 [Meriones unguiculatus]Q62575.1 RecName: Full=Interleukin-5; Short=IL-5; AltName: Full=Eosinophil differentiation factor; AltName: Full=T-cell replacing factor; Short=TRF; Flags: Precursor [Meriones unguiculatus]AAA65675.1 interleukin 5 [Meriones unguiculatus]